MIDTTKPKHDAPIKAAFYAPKPKRDWCFIFHAWKWHPTNSAVQHATCARCGKQKRRYMWS